MSESQQISEGAVQLARAASVKESARVLKCSTRTVSSWRSGEQLPSERFKAAIAEAWPQVGAHLWGVRAGFAGLAKAASGAAPVANDTAQTDDSPSSGKGPSAVARLEAQLARLDAAREEPGLTARARHDLEALSLKCAAQLARLTTHAITEAQILASEPWQTLGQRVVDKLSASDPIGFYLFWAACEPESAEPLEALAGIRHDHPAEVTACEEANASLAAALAAALRKREAEIKQPQLKRPNDL